MGEISVLVVAATGVAPGLPHRRFGPAPGSPTPASPTRPHPCRDQPAVGDVTWLRGSELR